MSKVAVHTSRKAPQREAILKAAHAQSECKQTQTKLELNQGTAARYPAVLRALDATSPGIFVVLKSGQDRRKSDPSTWWTLEVSAEYLPLIVPTLFDQAIEHVRREGVNVYNPILLKLLGPDGLIPSGKVLEDMIQKHKEAVFKLSSSYLAEDLDSDGKAIAAPKGVSISSAAQTRGTGCTTSFSQTFNDTFFHGNDIQEAAFAREAAFATHGGVPASMVNGGVAITKKSKRGGVPEPDDWESSFYSACPKWLAWFHNGPFSDSCISWFSLADGNGGAALAPGPTRKEQRNAAIADKAHAAMQVREQLTATGANLRPATPAAPPASSALAALQACVLADQQAHKRQKLHLAQTARRDRISELRLVLSMMPEYSQDIQTEEMQKVATLRNELLTLLQSDPPSLESVASPPRSQTSASSARISNVTTHTHEGSPLQLLGGGEGSSPSTALALASGDSSTPSILGDSSTPSISPSITPCGLAAASAVASAPGMGQ